MHTQKDLHLSPYSQPIKAILNLPGSKSLANRVLLLASLADGESIIHNVPDVAEDVVLMLSALQHLGIQVERLNSNNVNNADGCASYRVIGCGGEFPVQNATIFCGGSGTLARFLTAVLAFMPHANYQITGIERLLERPIGDLVDSLVQCGADISYVQQDGLLPLKINAFKCENSVTSEVKGGVSSQFLSGVLIGSGGVLRQNIEIIVTDNLISKPYVDMTLAILAIFGVDVISSIDTNKLKYICKAKHHIKSCIYTIEPDASSASYFMAMGSINNGDVTINHLNNKSLQGDTNFAYILAKMGAIVDYLPDGIRVRGHELHSLEIDMQGMPDVAMTLAVLALFAKGTTIIHGISTWRVKETDRAHAIYTELTKLGAMVILEANSISITPPKQISPNIAINTYNDHRMAMCFSLIALANVPVIINNYECVAKTFANYFDIYLTMK